MLNRGYAATSVYEICVEAGVTKGAFFNHFDSKETMAEELLKHVVESTLAPLAFALDPRSDPDLLSRLRRMFRAMLASQDAAKTKGLFDRYVHAGARSRARKFLQALLRGLGQVAAVGRKGVAGRAEGARGWIKHAFQTEVARGDARCPDSGKSYIAANDR